MTSRPVDGAIVEAFLESVSPMSLEVGLRVLEQLEQDLAVQRRQRELQLEQARYEARLAQRQYDAVDPDNRLVASELERRWNEKLERVTHLEQAYAQAEQEAEWNLTPEERQAIQELSQNLPRLLPLTFEVDCSVSQAGSGWRIVIWPIIHWDLPSC